MKLFNPSLNHNLPAPKHGGDLLEVSAEVSSEVNLRVSQKRSENGDSAFIDSTLADSALVDYRWIDLSSAVNRNPWPILPVPDFLWNELPNQRSLILAAETFYQRENFVSVSGTQQAIELLPSVLKFDADTGESQHSIPTVLVPEIGYKEHEFSWNKWGYSVESYSINKTRKNHDDLFHDLLMSDWQVLVLIQPNNPSGHCFSHHEIQQLIQVANDRNAYVVIDEAFIDSRPEKSILCSLNKTSKTTWPESLILLRSVGKFFGLAGARVGFVFAPEKTLKCIRSTIGPWPISTPATWLVSKALKDHRWHDYARMDLAKRRKKFEQELQPLFDSLLENKLDTLLKKNQVIEHQVEWSSTDFFFTVMPEISELACTQFFSQTFTQLFNQLSTQLKEQKIHVRLGDGWLRFALPAEEEFSIIALRLQTILTEVENVEGDNNLELSE